MARAERTLTANAFGTWFPKGTETLLQVPQYYQRYSLSCEAVSLRMALAYKNKTVSEDELIQNLKFATLKPAHYDSRTNQEIWGDPEVGFVGRIDGSMPAKTGYGVYEKPILDLALRYDKAAILEPATLDSLIGEIAAGNPVVVWGSINGGIDISWHDESGKFIKAISGEHARVVVGFSGTESAPTGIILNDPVYGRIEMTTAEFLRDWGLLGNKGVVVY